MSIDRFVWNCDGTTLFGTASSAEGQALYRMVVERLADGSGWDWSVWRADDLTTAPRHGTAPTGSDGRVKAEEAARAWDAANPP